MELTPVPSCSVTSTQAQITVQVDDEAEISRPTRSWSARRALLWLTLVILVATCCNALIPVIYGLPVNQDKHETASEFQSLLSKDWPSMDVKQDLESLNHRDGLIMPSNRPVQHRAALEPPTRPSQKKSKKLPRRTKKNRHESTTPSTSTSSSLASFTTPTSATNPSATSTTTTLLPTISSTTTTATTTTTSSSPTISFEAPSSTTTTTTTTTTLPPPISGRARPSRRNRPNHSKRNLIKLRSKCFHGFVTIGTTEVASRELDKNAEAEAFLEIISLNSTNKNKTIVALRGDKSGHYLCLEKEKGFVSKRLGSKSIPRECQFIEKHLNGKYVRYVSFRGPRRFLSIDENGKPVSWRNHKRHKIHSKSCTNFLRVAPSNDEVRKIIRGHLLPKPRRPSDQQQPPEGSS